MDSILETFAKNARSASYHYADDTAKEWGHARRDVAYCLGLYDAYPDLHDELHEIAKGELWSLRGELQTRFELSCQRGPGGHQWSEAAHDHRYRDELAQCVACGRIGRIKAAGGVSV